MDDLVRIMKAWMRRENLNGTKLQKLLSTIDAKVCNVTMYLADPGTVSLDCRKRIETAFVHLTIRYKAAKLFRKEN